MKKINKEIELKIIKEYTINNGSMKKIGQKFNISNTTVYNILKRNNIISRSKGGINKININDICDLYYNQNKTLKEISDIYNVTLETIRQQLIISGNYHKKQLNAYTNFSLKEDYFEKIDTSRKAYYLGYLSADGNVIDNTLRLELNKKDKNILDNLNNDLCNNSKLGKHKDCLVFNCKSNKIIQDLKKYNIVPNKTFTIDFPNLSQEMMPHYIRGLIDGDGWTTKHIKTNRKTYSYGLGFCGNKQMVQHLKEHLVKTLNIYDVKIIKKGNIYQVLWASKKDIIKIRDYIYKDADLFLERKYNNIKDL